MALFTLCVCLLLPASLSAATLIFNVTLDSSTNGTGSPGTGTAVVTLDDVTGAFNISGSFSGLNGTSNNAHVHGLTASAGTGTAGVLTGLTFDAGVTAGNFSGSATLNPTEIAGVVAGRSYINIHSTTNGGGEIRGFLLNPVPEPSVALLGGLGLIGLLRRRR